MGLLSDIFGTPDAPDPPEMTEQERTIIARMQELAAGDPELDTLLKEFTIGAIEGRETLSPGLEREISEQRAVSQEEIARGLGSVGDVASTPGIAKSLRFEEHAGLAREADRRAAIARGEDLLTSAASRRITAAGAALGPLAQQRGLQARADLQATANRLGQIGGLTELGTTIGSAIESRRAPKKDGPRILAV